MVLSKVVLIKFWRLWLSSLLMTRSPKLSLLIFYTSWVVHQVNVILKVAADKRMPWAFYLSQSSNIFMTSITNFDFLISVTSYIIQIRATRWAKNISTLPAMVFPEHYSKSCAALHTILYAVIGNPFCCNL